MAAEDRVAAALDHDLAAVRAEGVLDVRRAGHVAHVDVVQPLGQGGLPGRQQRLDRRGRQVGELVHRDEPREVQRAVRPEVGHQPAAHLADHLQLVRVGRHDQVDDLEPHADLVQRLERVQDRLEPAGVELVSRCPRRSP